MSRNPPRIAYFSPIPPDRSGVADYSGEMLPHLAAHFEIDLYPDGSAAESPTGATAGGASRATASELGVRRIVAPAATDSRSLLHGYDTVLYHIGNSCSHLRAYRALLRHPGLVVLHDLSLSYLVMAQTRDIGRGDLLLSEVRTRYGDAAAENVRRAWYAGTAPPWEAEPFLYPLNERVLENAIAVLVHSDFARREVLRAAPAKTVVHLDHHAWRPPELTPIAASPTHAVRGHDGRSRSAADPRPLVFVTAGFLSPTKRVDVVVRALASIAPALSFEYRLVGEIYDEPAVRSLVRESGLAERVSFYGRVSKAELYRHLMEGDVCVNLRHPDHGETSGIVMRALACGRPVVVNDTGWFRELPNDCAAKITDAGDDLVDRLAAELLRIGRRKACRASMGVAAADYAASRDPGSRARGYVDFIAAGWNASSEVQGNAGLEHVLEFCCPDRGDELARHARKTLRELQAAPR